MKKIGVYFAVLIVLAAFGMTILAHAGDLPAVPLTGESGSDLSEVNTDYEVPISFPSETETETETEAVTKALTISQTQLQLIYRQETALTANDTVTWKSSNDAVVKVDPASGSLYAAGRGTATVTAATEDGRTASCTVTVRYTIWQWFIRIFLLGWIWY